MKLQRPPPEIRIFLPVRVFEDRDAAAALAGFDGAHQACRAAAEDECIEGVGHFQSRIVINASFPQRLKPAIVFRA